ncbi:hypothetical protein WDU94_014766 [Cyamophila willieti]
MCWADCFLCCFSLQTGAIFTSGYMIALAIMGLLYLPFLPFSGEGSTFFIIYLYMILLFCTFLLALFGALSESKFALLAALILSVVALLLWLSLTVPSFLTKETPNCLGFRCGESHWLLPRQWVPHEDSNDNVLVYSTPRLDLLVTARNDVRAASFLREPNVNRLEERINALNNKDEDETHLKSVEAKLNELKNIRKAILAAQMGQPPEGKKRKNSRKEHDKKKENNKTNENSMVPATIETKDEKITTAKPKPTDEPAEKLLERMLDGTKLRVLNKKKHRKTGISHEIAKRRKRFLDHAQNEVILDENTLWSQLVSGPLKNRTNTTKHVQREALFLNVGVNKTLESFLFGNETNSLIRRTVNHQKTIISSCRTHKADSLINPTMLASVLLAFLYFLMLLTAIATLAMYYGTFLLNHGIEKCCISECMM